MREYGWTIEEAMGLTLAQARLMAEDARRIAMERARQEHRRQHDPRYQRVRRPTG